MRKSQSPKIYALLVFCLVLSGEKLMGQCPSLLSNSSDPDCAVNCSLCLGDEVVFSLTGDNMADGGCIDWYLGANGSDLINETYVGCSDITSDCAGGPQAMFIMIDPGGGGERCDEFIVIHTGDSGFDGSDIEVENIIGNPLSPYVLGNTSVFMPDCGLTAVGPSDFIPDNSILIIQTSAIGTVNFDITELCNLGLDIYVMASNNVSCGGGFFVNNANNEYSVILGCVSDVITYPTGSFDGWSYQDGEINSGLTVPQMDIPGPNPGVTTIDDFTLEITQDILDDFCSPSSVQLDIQGFLNPQVGGCADVETDIFNITLACPEINSIGPIDACETDGSIDLDLTVFDNMISGGSGSVNWYSDSGGNNAISNPSGFLGTGPVYAAVEVLGCESQLIEVIINIFPEPQLDLSFDPDPACDGDDISLFEDGGDAVDWNWEGPSFSSTDNNPLVTDAEGGTYFVTITDANMCTAEGEIEFIPIPGPDAEVDVSSTTICEGSCIDVEFTVTNGNGGPYELVWDILGLVQVPFTANTEQTTWTICSVPGIIIPNIDTGNNIVELPDFLTFLELQLISISESGCNGTVDADLIAIDIVEPPDANNAGPLEACSDTGMEASFDLSSLESTIGGGLDVSWFEDEDMDDEIFSPYMSASTTTVYAFAFDPSTGCYSDAIVINLIVNIPGDAGEPGTLEICEGEETSQDLFAALNGMPDMGGTWTDMDGTGVNLNNPMSVDFSSLTASDYTFVYMFSGIEPCMESSAEVVLTVHPLPQITLGDEDCTPDNLNYILNFEIDVVGTVLTDVGSIVAIDNQNFELTVSTSESTFTLTILNPDTGCSLEETFTIPDCDCGTIQDPDISSPVEICEGQAFPELDANVPAGLTANWYDAGMQLILADSDTFTPSAAGTYFVEIVDPNDPNCFSDLIEFEVVVLMPSNAGMSAMINVCASYGLGIDIASLIGMADGGGVWSDDQMTGADITDPGNVTLSTLGIGTYTFSYTITNAACGDASSVVTVDIIDTPDPGMSIDTSICKTTNELYDFENMIGPFDTGGDWTEGTTLIDLSTPSMVDLTTVPPGNYLINYSIAGNTGSSPFCETQVATINLNLFDLPYAGDDLSSSICIGSSIDLTDFLANNNAAGAFESLDPTVMIMNGSMVETTSLPLGSYDFHHIIPEMGACASDTALITLLLNDQLTAGDDVILELCPEDNIQLNALLQNADLGGVFTNINTAEIYDMAVLDASNLAAQTIMVAYEIGGGTCPVDQAILTLTFVESPDLTLVSNTVQVCEDDCENIEFLSPLMDDIQISYNLFDENDILLESGVINVQGNTNVLICSNMDGLLSLSNLESDQDYSVQFFSLNFNGCDFPYDQLVNIISETPEPTMLNDTYCVGESVMIGNGIFDVDNPNGTVTIVTPGKCDSTVIVDLIFEELPEGDLIGSYCPDRAFDVNGTIYDINNPSGIEMILGGGSNGCDSLVNIDLQFLQEIIIDVSESLCDDESLVVGGETFDFNNPTGQVVIPGNGMEICDSTFNVSLNFDRNFIINVLEACPGDGFGYLEVDTIMSTNDNYVLQVDGAAYAINVFPFELELGVGDYTVELDNGNGCIYTEMISISNTTEPAFDILSVSIDENIYLLDVNTSVNLDSIEWSGTASLDCVDCLPATTAPISGTQVFQVTGYYGNGCTLIDSLQLSEVIGDCIFMPNIFSPDGDGVNDEFFIQTCQESMVNSFQIFDRWGNLIWERANYLTSDTTQSWDGRFNGSDVSSGVYVYFALVDIPNLGEQIVKGSVTILR